MTNVIELKRREKNSIKSTEDAYFFVLDGVRFSFGGAFVRAIISKVDSNRNDISSIIASFYDKNIHAFSSLLGDEKELGDLLVGQIIKDKELCLDVVNNLRSQEEFDSLMSEDSEHLSIMPIVLGFTIAKYYTAFDLNRMIKDNWMQLEGGVTEFFNSPLYSFVNEKL